MHRKRLCKMLGLSMLAVVGVMAVSASAAQAKWLIRVNGVSVQSVLFVSAYGLTLIFVPGLNLDIHCDDGIGSLLLGTSVNDTVLLHNGWELFLDCDVVGVKTCTVHSSGEKSGNIKIEGTGTGQMEGSKTFVKRESKKLALIEIEGALCPLNEVAEELSGSMTLTVDNAETEEKVHTSKLDDQKLLFGAEAAQLYGAEKSTSISGSLKMESGATWSVKLVNL